MHRRVWIDDRTGRRLAGVPDDDRPAHPEVVEFWPSDMARLFRTAGLPKASPPPLLGSTLSRNQGSPEGLRILSPEAGRIYHLRLKDEEGTLLLEASTPSANDKVDWFVDSTCLGSYAANLPVSWKLQEGRHVVRAVNELGAADSRVVVVTTVE